MTRKKWTKTEERLLFEYQSKYIIKTISKKLNRTEEAIKEKAKKLGIKLHSKKDPWKKWMIYYLKDNINKRPIKEIQEVLGMSYTRVRKKCDELDINYEYEKNKWTAEELEILKNAPILLFGELKKLLPNRTKSSIYEKMKTLNISTISRNFKLTEDMKKFIKDNLGVIPDLEIARKLKVSISTVDRYKKELNLEHVNSTKKWTTDVIEKLKKDASNMTTQQLAKKYKTTISGIRYITLKNGIKPKQAKNNWTAEIDDKLRMYVDQGITINVISKKLNIDVESIRKRVKKLGLIENINTKHWNQGQIELFKSMSLEKDVVELGRILNKSEKQLIKQAQTLGIKLIGVSTRKIFTDEEILKIINLSRYNDAKTVAKILGKSESAVYKKARELKIKFKKKEKIYWAPEEEQKLRELSKSHTIKEIAQILNRSIYSVRGKVERMGLDIKRSEQFWTEEDQQNLEELAKSKTLDEISKIMNKSTRSIEGMLSRMGVKTIKERKIWTDEENYKLKELLSKYKPSKVAKILNRTEKSIISQAKKIGILFKSVLWTSLEEEMLSDLWGTHSIEKISKKLGRSEAAIRSRAFSLGLGSQRDRNYDIKLDEIEKLFNVNRGTITIAWVILGLKLHKCKRSENSEYYAVSIHDLYEFLKDNQNIWDSRYLEEHMLGIEPDWLKEKRKRDISMEEKTLKLDSLNKHQLMKVKNIYTELCCLKDESSNEESKKLVKKGEKYE